MSGLIPIFSPVISALEPVAGATGIFLPEDIVGSGTVTSWNDSSGNGYHFNTIGGDPQHSVGGGINGYDAVDFDGAGDYIQNTTDTTNLISTTAYTIFGVVVVDTVGTDDAGFDNENIFGDSSDIVLNFGFRSSGEFTIGQYDGTHDAVSSTGGDFSTATDYVFVHRYNGTNCFGSLNGTEISVASGSVVSGAGRKQRLGDGNIQRLDGRISEMMFYDTHLSAGDQTQNLDYLKAKYGISF